VRRRLAAAGGLGKVLQPDSGGIAGRQQAQQAKRATQTGDCSRKIARPRTIISEPGAGKKFCISELGREKFICMEFQIDGIPLLPPVFSYRRQEAPNADGASHAGTT